MKKLLVISIFSVFSSTVLSMTPLDKENTITNNTDGIIRKELYADFSTACSNLLDYFYQRNLCKIVNMNRLTNILSSKKQALKNSTLNQLTETWSRVLLPKNLDLVMKYKFGVKKQEFFLVNAWSLMQMGWYTTELGDGSNVKSLSDLDCFNINIPNELYYSPIQKDPTDGLMQYVLSNPTYFGKLLIVADMDLKNNNTVVTKYIPQNTKFLVEYFCEGKINHNNNNYWEHYVSNVTPQLTTKVELLSKQMFSLCVNEPLKYMPTKYMTQLIQETFNSDNINIELLKFIDSKSKCQVASNVGCQLNKIKFSINQLTITDVRNAISKYFHCKTENIINNKKNYTEIDDIDAIISSIIPIQLLQQKATTLTKLLINN